MHNNESFIFIFSWKIKQALGVLLSEQSQYYNPLLVLLPLCRGVTDTS